MKIIKMLFCLVCFVTILSSPFLGVWYAVTRNPSDAQWEHAQWENASKEEKFFMTTSSDIFFALIWWLPALLTGILTYLGSRSDPSPDKIEPGEIFALCVLCWPALWLECFGGSIGSYLGPPDL